MNAIFSAQKLKVTIDVCKIYGPDTIFLQQAAHLTNGSYIYLERRDALLQYLIMSFLPPPLVRKVLAVPRQDKIDFRAACFCHKNIVGRWLRLLGVFVNILPARTCLLDLPVSIETGYMSHRNS
ncbi:transcription factor Tfb4-domain-containing protein [Pisolithus croceorrhizus]|nr:transcription factor Tfb4-domain-containing protein [Pisolithus croceorrhizus]